MERRSAMIEVSGHRSNVRSSYGPGEKRVGMVGEFLVAVIFTSNSD